MELQVLLWGDQALKNMQNGKGREKIQGKNNIGKLVQGASPGCSMEIIKISSTRELLTIYNPNGAAFFISGGTGSMLLMKLKYLAYYAKTKQVTKY